MAENSIDRKKVRDDLKIDRAMLFEQFLKRPKDTRLALATKIIDDQIANCSEWIRTKEKSAEKELLLHELVPKAGKLSRLTRDLGTSPHLLFRWPSAT